MRELAQGYAASQQPDSLFDATRLHWRSDRIEFAAARGPRRVARRRARAGRAFLSPDSVIAAGERSGRPAVYSSRAAR
jgi:hypothetical protein